MHDCSAEAITILSRIGWEHLRAHKPIFRAELMSLCGSTATTKLGPDIAGNNNTLLPNKEILIQGHLIFDKLNVMGILFSVFFPTLCCVPQIGVVGATDQEAGGATCVRPNMTAPKPLCINCLFGSFFYGRRKQVWGEPPPTPPTPPSSHYARQGNKNERA